jgi:hypothetical protein
MSGTAGSAKQPGTTIRFGQQVIYGEMYGSRLVPRDARCIQIEDGKPLLRVYRPMAQGKDHEVTPVAYADSLTKACWSNPEDVAELITLTVT